MYMGRGARLACQSRHVVVILGENPTANSVPDERWHSQVRDRMCDCVSKIHHRALVMVLRSLQVMTGGNINPSQFGRPAKVLANACTRVAVYRNQGVTSFRASSTLKRQVCVAEAKKLV